VVLDDVLGEIEWRAVATIDQGGKGKGRGRGQRGRRDGAASGRRQYLYSARVAARAMAWRRAMRRPWVSTWRWAAWVRERGGRELGEGERWVRERGG
jgi:hypothetical protein